MLIYLITFRPMDSKLSNFLVVATEYCIYMGALTAMLFTDYVYDPESRDTLGVFMYMILFMFVLL